MSQLEIYYEPDLPEGWEIIEPVSYPEMGSKGYRREDGAFAQLVNMYDQGWFIVQLETADGEWYEKRHYPKDHHWLTKLLGFAPGKLPPAQRAYQAAREDLERVVEHYEETGGLPEEDNNA